ncbi:hypothetical protein [Mucilaginibacter sp. UR6-11]|uniref:hypothetical protein n=1 Tax=Mucilaginibacter sp. UR6-11 TaxID=1435644 RepID=UPI001E5CFE20|nr:hypothetical protein [Mucilaginibacter sp. UR6-11]MCC8425232.1 hypothetical protein [Mucilaginibacter sp. UR6-11]
MKGYKLFIITIAVLVAINCILLGVFWSKKNRHLPGKNGPPPMASDYLIKELNLTLAKEKRYDTLRMQHAEFTRKLNEQSNKLRDEFFENIKSPVPDTARAYAIERKLAAMQFRLDTATFYHFRRFRAILDADQQIKFDHILPNVLHMMGRQHPEAEDKNRNGTQPHSQGPPPNGPPPGN